MPTKTKQNEQDTTQDDQDPARQARQTTKPTDKQREQARQDVEDIQLENHKRNITSLPTQPYEEIVGKDEESKLIFDVIGGEVFVSVEGTVVLDREGALNLSKKAGRAAQAVS